LFSGLTLSNISFNCLSRPFGVIASRLNIGLNRFFS
jgi:hypothetical protein